MIEEKQSEGWWWKHCNRAGKKEKLLKGEVRFRGRMLGERFVKMHVSEPSKRWVFVDLFEYLFWCSYIVR